MDTIQSFRSRFRRPSDRNFTANYVNTMWRSSQYATIAKCLSTPLQIPPSLPPLRNQVSLSNPFTIPIFFRLETWGPFVVNPVLPGCKNTEPRLFNGLHGASDVGATTLNGDGTSRSSRKIQRENNGHTGRHCNNPGERVGSSSRGAMQLLPGQSIELELVFLPARAPAEEMAKELLHTSFTPGSEVSF